MNSSKFNLIQYSAISACFLALHQNVRGQAIYTNIDPDLELDNNWESAGIDMNNDGVPDFGFLNRSFDFSTFYSYYSSHFEAIYAGPQSPNNEIAALTHVISPSYGGFTVYFPFALNESDLINEVLTFHNNGYQTMAYRYIQTDGDYFPKGGIWYPEVLDHFLGVRFIDTSDCLHYGWIRCDIKDNGRTLVIKDYAYEIKCNTGILAGDTIGDTSTVNLEEINLFNVNIYSFNSDVFIQFQEISENYSYKILNLSGAKISSGILSGKNSIIYMSIKPKGYYFVEIYKGRQTFVTKKIFIN